MFSERMNIFVIRQVHGRLQFVLCLATKSCELWSSNYRHLKVKSYPPNSSAFSEDHILASKRCYAFIFFTCDKERQSLLAHTPTVTGVP